MELPCKDCVVLAVCITKLHELQTIVYLATRCTLLWDYIYTQSSNDSEKYDRIDKTQRYLIEEGGF